ncbi:MAG: hypothetical protein WD793_04850 [Steroidobacteraceae bacterium]
MMYAISIVAASLILIAAGAVWTLGDVGGSEQIIDSALCAK